MKKFYITLLTATTILSVFLFSGCGASVNLTDYVSEYRSEIYTGTNGEYSLFASFSEREYPYTADGNIGNMSNIFEIAVTVPDNTKTYSVQYSFNEKKYSSELSFDSVLLVHRCSQTVPAPSSQSIEFSITVAESDKNDPVVIQAKSVKPQNALSLSELLPKVREQEKERFERLTSGNTFHGELYVRLLYENDRCYFYIGIIDRNGTIYSILSDPCNGDIIATHGE